MKHIDSELIQKYIDKEASKEEMAIVNEHLKSCVACRNAVDTQRKLATEIRSFINSLSEEVIEIPEFIKSGKKRKKQLRIIYLLNTGAASVACVLAFLLLYPKEKNMDNYERLFYNTEFEFDANRSVTQQDIVIKVFDSEGNLSEYNM